MIFNGHTADSVDQIDEETFADICVMFHDGILGNKGVFDALAPLTAAVFNYFREKGTAPHKTDAIFPWVSEYDKNPDFDVPDAAKVNNTLLAFLTSAPGFQMEKANGDHIQS